MSYLLKQDPRYQSKNAKKVYLTILVKPEQREEWKRKAESEGLTLTAWVTTNLVKASKR